MLSILPFPSFPFLSFPLPLFSSSLFSSLHIFILHQTLGDCCHPTYPPPKKERKNKLEKKNSNKKEGKSIQSGIKKSLLPFHQIIKIVFLSKIYGKKNSHMTSFLGCLCERFHIHCRGIFLTFYFFHPFLLFYGERSERQEELEKVFLFLSPFFPLLVGGTNDSLHDIN